MLGRPDVQPPNAAILLIGPQGISKFGRRGMFEKWMGAEVVILDTRSVYTAGDWAVLILSGKQNVFNVSIKARENDQRNFNFPKNKLTRRDALLRICKKGDFVVYYDEARHLIRILPKEGI